MNYIICYDISLDSLRTKVSQKLLEFGGVRIQKSVFYFHQCNRRKIAAIKQAMQGVLNVTEAQDHLLFVPIDMNTPDTFEGIGENPALKEAQNKPLWKIL